MGTDLSKFKVVYKDRVLKALCLAEIVFGDDTAWDAQHKKPEYIEILIINDDGNIEAFRDKAQMFQFIPILN